MMMSKRVLVFHSVGGGWGQVIMNSNENTGSAACFCLPAATEKCLSLIVVNLWHRPFHFEVNSSMVQYSMDEMIGKVNKIMNWKYEIKWSCDPHSYKHNFSNCVENSEKFRTSIGFQPVTSQINWNMKPQAAEASHVSSNFPVAQLIRASYWHRVVLGSNPIEFKSWVFQSSLRNC